VDNAQNAVEDGRTFINLDCTHRLPLTMVARLSTVICDQNERSIGN